MGTLLFAELALAEELAAAAEEAEDCVDAAVGALVEVASSIAALYTLCDATTMMRAMTFTTTAAMAIPLPARVPRIVATSPTMPKMVPKKANNAEALLMNGKNEVRRAMMPKTREAIPIADLGFWAVAC